LDFILQISDEKTAIAGFAAFGLTSVDAKGNRTVRQSGMVSVPDMEVLADAVEATKERVAAQVVKGAELDAALVEGYKIDPQTTIKPELKDLSAKQDYRRSLTEWATISLPQRMVPTGNMALDPFGNEQPEMAPDGFYYIVLRWNGDAMLPPMPPGFTILWSSVSPGIDPKTGFPIPAPDYPSGLPRFA
jgi:hypothetical protein